MGVGGYGWHCVSDVLLAFSVWGCRAWDGLTQKRIIPKMPKAPLLMKKTRMISIGRCPEWQNMQEPRYWAIQVSAVEVRHQAIRPLATWLLGNDSCLYGGSRDWKKQMWTSEYTGAETKAPDVEQHWTVYAGPWPTGLSLSSTSALLPKCFEILFPWTLILSL